MEKAASIAQLAGVDALRIISTIVQAAQAVHRNREACQELVNEVELIRHLLRMLRKNTEMMRREVIVNALSGLEETLNEAYAFVTSCRDCSVAYRILMGWKQEDKLRRIRKKLASYLRLYPMIVHADLIRLYDRPPNGASPSTSSSPDGDATPSTNSLPQDAQEVVISSTDHRSPEIRAEEGSVELTRLERRQRVTQSITAEQCQQEGYQHDEVTSLVRKSRFLRGQGLPRKKAETAFYISGPVGRTVKSYPLVAHAGELISLIQQAVVKVRQHRDECEHLALRLETIAALLPQLQDPEVMQRPEARRPLNRLEDMLREAHKLVVSCQGISVVLYRPSRVRKQVDKFRDIQRKIDKCLLVLAFISHPDTIPHLPRIYNALHQNGNQTLAGKSADHDSSSENSNGSVARINGPVAVDDETNLVAFKGELAHERFTLAELAAATGYFNVETKISGGSFRTVYKGKLCDGREVAISRCGAGAEPHVSTLEEKNSAFLSEFGIVTRVSHKNIVRFVGYCNEGDERLLVSDYMENGTLHDHLHPNTSRPSSSTSSPVMASWKTRIEILLGAARGIEYLNSYAVPPVVHCNISSSSILLNSNWRAHVSDFATSLVWHDTEENARLPLNPPVGTVGYVDPEYSNLGCVTMKSDVYSFGVLILEVLTGKPAIHYAERSKHPATVPASIYRGDKIKRLVSVVDYAVPSIVQRELGNVLDSRMPEPRLQGMQDAVQRVACTAVHCLMIQSKQRPSMAEVVFSLEAALDSCNLDRGEVY